MQEATDGQEQSQGYSPESDSMDETPQEFSLEEKFADMEARNSQLVDGMNEMRGMISQMASANSHQSQATQVEEELDDDEPLTSSKVSKIVKSAITTAVSRNEEVNTRKSWDEKVKVDFNVADPKFNAALNKVWKELVDGGMDPNAPKALYTAAKVTADRVGTKKAPVKTQTRNSEESDFTSEAPTAGSRGSDISRTNAKMVSDTDTRVRFYNMKGTKSQEQIKAFRVKLAKDDAASGKARR